MVGLNGPSQLLAVECSGLRWMRGPQISLAGGYAGRVTSVVRGKLSDFLEIQASRERNFPSSSHQPPAGTRRPRGRRVLDKHVQVLFGIVGVGVWAGASTPLHFLCSRLPLRKPSDEDSSISAVLPSRLRANA